MNTKIDVIVALVILFVSAFIVLSTVNDLILENFFGFFPKIAGSLFVVGIGGFLFKVSG